MALPALCANRSEWKSPGSPEGSICHRNVGTYTAPYPKILHPLVGLPWSICESRTLFGETVFIITISFNTLVLPTFLYGSENWTLTASQRRRIEAAEMKLLRPLAGYTLYDHKTNEYIRRELRITGILDKIDEYRRNGLSHLQRMPQNRIPLKSYHYRPEGRRTIGRPKKRWRKQL